MIVINRESLNYLVTCSFEHDRNQTNNGIFNTWEMLLRSPKCSLFFDVRIWRTQKLTRTLLDVYQQVQMEE